MDLLVNELSIAGAHTDVAEARRTMERLLQTIRAAASLGCSRTLRTTTDFWSLEIAQGYPVATWSSDPEVDLEQRRFIRQVAAKGPFIDDELTALAGENVLLDCSTSGGSGKAALLAALMELPLLSTDRTPWQLDPLTANVVEVTEEDSHEREVALCNFFHETAVTRRSGWFEEKLRGELVSGMQLASACGTVLDRLELTGSARAQLEALTGAEQPFRFVVKHLFAINQRMRGWTDGRFENGYPFPCSEESAQTMSRFGAERTFVCPDGQTREFPLHSKINVAAWRIHFIPDRTSGKALIGYVGRHLPTVNDPT